MACKNTTRLDLSKGKNADIEGLSELIDTIDSLKNRVAGDDLRRVLMRGAIKIREEAKRLVPVKTGRLKKSIIATYGNKESDKEGNINVVVMTKGGPEGAPHAHLVEFGHSGAPAHQFMRPAVSAAREEATRTIAEGLKALIEKAESETMSIPEIQSGLSELAG